jgi:chemotaxis protein methyltransferase CheR
MSPAEFMALRELIQRRFGILFSDDAASRLDTRLRPRLTALGLGSFTQYFFALEQGAQAEREFDELIELITTHETYFFREKRQLDAFSLEILPQLHKLHSETKTLRIWSAGCSTGEEVYTIAMLMLDHGGFSDWRIEVFGSDISRKVIARARQAHYGPNSFRDTDPRFLRRFFDRHDNLYRVRDEVRALTSFGTINLVEPNAIALVAPVDVIFCRNVMMYFDPATRRGLVQNFYRKLRPYGFLLLGHAESLLNISTDFEAVSLRNDLVYRRGDSPWRLPHP